MFNSFRWIPVMLLLSESVLGRGRVVAHDSPWRYCEPLGCPQTSSRWGADCTARPPGSTWTGDASQTLDSLRKSPILGDCKLWSVILTLMPAGCHSGAEPPRCRHSGACSRCSWRQGSLDGLQPPRLPSVGCSLSRPVQTCTVCIVFEFALQYFAKFCWAFQIKLACVCYVCFLQQS